MAVQQGLPSPVLASCFSSLSKNTMSTRGTPWLKECLQCKTLIRYPEKETKWQICSASKRTCIQTFVSSKKTLHHPPIHHPNTYSQHLPNNCPKYPSSSCSAIQRSVKSSGLTFQKEIWILSRASLFVFTVTKDAVKAGLTKKKHIKPLLQCF